MMLKRMRLCLLPAGVIGSLIGVAAPLRATSAKLDEDTCNQLRLEQMAFKQSGVVADYERGAEWARTNLTAERMREIERYIALDEQVKFGCRDAKLTLDAQRAADEARKIELGVEADPKAGAQDTGASDDEEPSSPAPAKSKASAANAGDNPLDAPVVKKKPRPATPVQGEPVPKPQAKADAASSDEPAPKVKPKSKPKPKADDAYSAPSGAPQIQVP